MIDVRSEEWVKDFVARHNLVESVSILGEMDFGCVLAVEAGADVCVWPFLRIKKMEHIYPLEVVEYLAMRKVMVATRLEE